MGRKKDKLLAITLGEPYGKSSGRASMWRFMLLLMVELQAEVT